MTLASVIVLLVLGQDVGTSAPDLDRVRWLNTAKEKAPSLRRKIGVIVFWSSDNPQSRMALPGLQRLHEALGDRICVATVSRDDEETVRKYLDRHACTMATGSDAGCAAFWEVRGWPQAFLVDRKGKVAWKGDPFKVVRESWKLLGIETDAGELLTALVKAGRNQRRAREVCDLLVATSPTRFDLEAWARDRPRPEVESPPKLDAPAALTAYLDGKEEAVHALRGKTFDLAAWARARRDRLFPLDARELKALLKDRRYQTVLDALVDRSPPAGVVAAAGRDKVFARYCAAHAAGRGTFARKAVMAYHWPIAGETPSDNDAFWRELSVQSMLVDDDQKKMTGLTIANQDVMGPEMPDFARRCLAQRILMEAIGSRKAVPRDLAKQAAAAYDALVAELKKKYG
jgi:hypothetical protein